MSNKKKYMVFGRLPGIGFIRKWVWTYSEQQALKLIHLRLQQDPKYKKIVIPPLSLHCRVKEVWSP